MREDNYNDEFGLDLEHLMELADYNREDIPEKWFDQLETLNESTKD